MALGEQQLKLAHRMQYPCSLVYFDVNDLKTINDTFGHDEENKALIDTAKILKRTFRDSDIIARVGGDEFIVLVLQSSIDDSKVIETRLRLETAVCNNRTNRRYELSLSAGHVYPDPATPITLETMIARADAEMYKQKRGTHRSGDPASKLCMDQEADLELPRAL